MARFYLIGGNDFDLKNDFISSHLILLTKKEKPKILLFPTASNDDIKSINNFKKEFENFDYDLNIAYLTKKMSTDYIFEMAKTSDIIYFQGGNTAFFLDIIYKYNYVSLFKKLVTLDTIIAGISAGAIIWCNEGLTDKDAYKDNDNYFNYKMIKGLGIIDISFCPHFNQNQRILYFKNLINCDTAYALDNNTSIYIDNNIIKFFSIDHYHVFKFRKENNYIMECIDKQKIATLGPKGTFSEMALIKYSEIFNLDLETKLLPTIQKVASKIDEIGLGILPFENTIDGYVQETLDMLNLYNFNIVSEIVLPIDFIFVSKAKDIKDVKKVYVQFKAKGQCLDFINNNNLEVVETESNITSYERMKNSGPTYGAIIPSHVKCSEYPLVINNICDRSNNFTRFLVVNKKKEEYLKDSNKCSLILNAKKDNPGILMDALLTFKKANINLSAIMSRPTKEELGKYYFYVEFSMIEDRVQLEHLINEIEKIGNFKVKLLGYYKTY